MKVLTILQAVLDMNDSESMDIVDFREYDDRSPYNFLKDFFGVSGENNIKGNFTIGRWFYSYCQELGWPDWRERKEHGEKLEPDVKLIIDDDTIIYLYKMDD